MDDDDDGDDDGQCPLDTWITNTMSDVQTLSIAASRKLTRSLNGYDLNNIEIILPDTMMIVHLDVDF